MNRDAAETRGAAGSGASAPRAARPIESISVLIPTRDGEPYFERTLAALRRQRVALPWDVRVVDSGSTDGTLERLAAAQADFPVPFAHESIHPLEFDHGDTRNRLVARSSGDLCVFLTQDAIPAGDGWLARLAANFDDPTVAAAYCRNVPRADADPVTRILCAGDPGYRAGSEVVAAPADARKREALDPDARRLLTNFNDVASAVRREVWQLCPFPRTTFGEDVLLADALLFAGWRIAYDAEATVEHSHDYDPAETRARARIDGEFNRVWLDRLCVASASDARALTRRFDAGDRAGLVSLGLAGDELEDAVRRARERRRATFEGLYEGGRTARRETPPRPLDGRRLRILQVVHGFPPEVRAGVEVYTLHLSRALASRGHEVTVLARGEAEPGAEPRVEEESLDGLRVLRLRRSDEHRRLRQTWEDARVDALVDELLGRERFDVAHFQHLLHLSVGLVGVARARGLATLAHLHDYWGLCARVQLIRPDRTVCPHTMGYGCLLCLKGRALDWIPRAAAGSALLRPVLMPAARAFGAAGFERPRSYVGRNLVDLHDLDRRDDAILGALASADLCFAPSRFLRAKFLATGRFDERRLVLSPYGSKADDLAPSARRPSTPLRIGFVGSLVWYKGLDVLLDALKVLEPGRVQLSVHGHFDPERDPYQADLRARAEGLPVTFEGPFGDGERAAVWERIDVIVVPSVWYENSPITIHEAFRTRTPVVASRLGGMAELVEDGRSGLLFEAGDAADLARCLGRLAADPGLVAALAAGAPPVKTMDEDAADMEFRYRGLLARTRSSRTR